MIELAKKKFNSASENDLYEDIDRMLNSGLSPQDLKQFYLKSYVSKSKKFKNGVSMLGEAEDYREKENRLLNRFFKALQKDDIIFTRRAIKDMDTIDFRFHKNLKSSNSPSDIPGYKRMDGDEEYVMEHPYCAVPPLSKGVIRANTDRYLVFEINNLDVENYKYDLFLEDYAKDNGVWMVNSSTVATIFWNDKKVNIENEYYVPLSKLFEFYPFDNETIFSEDEMLFWKEVIKPNILLLDAMDEKENSTHVIHNYLHAIITTNMELGSNKLHTLRSQSSNEKAKVITEVAEEDDKKKKQLIRNVGDSGISIRSVSIPREATYERVVKYKVAAWNTRGHERKLKSGKIVYVKPSVHHRKCLQKTDEVAQTIIRID